MTTRQALPLLIFLLPLLACRGIDAQGGGLAAPTILQGLEPDSDELDLRTTPVVRAVQRAANSVVSIYILHEGGNRDAVEGQGSGVIVDELGLVITNWHVIATYERARDGRKLQVRLKDERRFDAALLSFSPEHDLALLQLKLPAGQTVKPVRAGRSESLMVGETVIAIGNPQGHANTVTVGVLSAIDRSIDVRAPDGQVRRYEGLLQTDAAINQGNSGGALLDITGKLIGINNAMAMGVENIGFAIPVDTVKRVFEDELLRYDNLASVWIGARIGERDGALVIDDVSRHGPAERVGLRKGDTVVSIEGNAVRSAFDYHRALASAQVDAPIPMVIERDGKRLEAAPFGLGPAARAVVQIAGVEFAPVTVDQDKELLRSATLAYYRGTRGRVRMLPVALRVRDVHPGSPAESLGMQSGDLVLGTVVWNPFYGRRNAPLASLQDFADRLVDASRSGALPITVMRGDEILEGELEVEATDRRD